MSGGSSNLSTSKSSSASGPLEDIVEPVANSLTELRKKIRNLEKKKTKLESLREDVKKSGKPLNEDQALALSRYDDTLQQLETCRELCKNFEGCAAEIQKCYKKQLKKNELTENQRLFDLEKYRAVVRALDSEDILKRYAEQDETFQEPQRRQLRVLRKILLPLRSDFRASDFCKSLNDYLKLVTEQQSNLLNGRPVNFFQEEEEELSEGRTLLDHFVTSSFFIEHPDLLFVKGLPHLQQGGTHLGGTHLGGTLQGGTHQGRSSTGSVSGQQVSPLTSQGKGDSREHHAPVGFSGSVAASQGFHYAAGEPIQSMSFTNSKLNSLALSPTSSTPSLTTSHSAYGGSVNAPAHTSTTGTMVAGTTGPIAAGTAGTTGPIVAGTIGGTGTTVAGTTGGTMVAGTMVAGIPLQSRSTPTATFPLTSPVKEGGHSPAAADVVRRQSESDQVSQNQAAWQSGRPFGTFDASKVHGESASISPDGFPSQENRLETDFEGNRGQNGGGANNGPLNNFNNFNNSNNFNNFNNFNNNNNNNNFRLRGNGRPFEHRSFDAGRNGGRGDDRGGPRGGDDRGGPRGGGGRGGRFVTDNNNRGPRGNGQDYDGGRDDGDQQQHLSQKGLGGSGSGSGGTGGGGVGTGGGGGQGNDADFGVFHVDNPSFKGRTGNNNNYANNNNNINNNNINNNVNNNMLDDRRGNGIRRSAQRGGLQLGVGGVQRGN